jgi:Tol biopolymer transport system component
MDGMSSNDLDRRLAGWFATAAAEDVPHGLLEDVFGVTRTSRQRRGPLGRLMTAAAEWWRAPVVLRVAPRQLVYLVVVGLLVAVAALAIATVGAHRPAPPFGLAANGLMAFDRDGDIVIARYDRTGFSEVAAIPGARGPVFAPDGSRLAFYGTVAGADTIMVALPNGRDPVVLSAGIVLDDLAMEAPMSWSPDSRSIVFGGLSGGQRRIFVASVEGGAPVAVGDDGLFRIDPAWSPDGAWIAFHGFRPAEDAAAGLYHTLAGLYLVRPDGRDQTLLVEGRGGDFIYRKPQWLPDLERSILAYAVGEPSLYDIAVFDIDSMTQTVISHAVAAELWPAWAPDGSALAWAGSDATIRVARPDGTILRVLPADVDYELVWSPDGRYLLGWASESRIAMVIMSSDGSSATIRIPIEGRGRSHWSWQRQAP